MGIYRFLSGLYYAGLILILAGIIMHLSDMQPAPLLFAVGLIPVLGIRIYNFVIAPSHRRRINGILMISALFLGGALAAIWFRRSYWVIFIAISAVIDGYTTFRKHS
jgi:hypothetical protein